MPNNWSSNYTFPLLTNTGTSTGINVDMSDMFVRKELFIDAGLWGCGYNNFGQIGNNGNTNISSMVQIGTLNNWKQIYAGPYTTGAVKIDGTLWMWGYGGNGNLGNNAIANYSSPIQIGALTTWKQVVTSQSPSLAIKTDGTLWSWGNNTFGQLGLGNTSNYSSPIQIGALTTWKQITVGGYYNGSTNVFQTAAIQTNGTLWAWGYNGNGQLGNGSYNNAYSSPIQIGALTIWQQVSTGVTHTAAIQTNGTLWTWGLNGQGQLGNGTTTAYSSPIQVGSLTSWKQVSCGYNSIYAIQTNGTLWSWGLNEQGQLGNGTIINYSSPIQVGTLTNWKYISSSIGLNYMTLVSAGYVMAIKTDGTLWSWGNNYYGSLGNGITTNYSSPIQVGTLTNWKQVSNAGFASMAISSPDLPD
jgi:hypothetical protein